ncbi:MAG: hypothetical protein A2X36_12275 [Elusimicrobia bacterium GWA2_69_24]|nr:MAG: hypothetical protein A2X36_12275 [Elusimicrobia bacterium GWA2_69_24]HBL17755.1 hypothetical protein [Elusimicrobiota bacterium]
MKRLLLSLSFAVLSGAPVLGADAPRDGVVVRTEGGRLFFDLGRESGITLGQRFEVYKEKGELKHPVTGASLGPIIEKLAAGTITEIQEKYSVGTAAGDPAAVTPGDKVRMLPRADPESGRPSTTLGTAPAPAGQSRVPLYRSPLVPLEAVDIAAGDLDGDGAAEVALADPDRVLAYRYSETAAEWTPLCSGDLKGTGSRYVSLEAADLDQDGRAEVFATLHNGMLKRMETQVLDCGAGVFSVRAVIPWMVRSFDSQGVRALAVQQLEDDRNSPLSNAYTLDYSDGKYRPKDSLRKLGVDWIYAFGAAPGPDGPLLLGYTEADRLRVRFRKGGWLRKGSWLSKENYGQTSTRLEWQGRMLRFNPRLYADGGVAGLAGVYTLRNIPRFGSLAGSFGLYGKSEFHHLAWNGLSLEPDWQAELGGYAAGLTELPGGDRRFAVAVVGAGGKTSVWTFGR